MMRATGKKFTSAIIVFLILGVCAEYYTAQYVSNLTFTKATVHNTSDSRVFTEKTMPGFDFVQQDEQAGGIKFFRNEIAHIISEHQDDLALAAAIRKWGRDQQVNFGRGANADDPLLLLKQQRNGRPGACRRFAIILTTALTSAGFDARLINIAPNFDDTVFNHTFVEVWIPSLEKWVMIDSTYDAFYLLDGVPASVYEMHRAFKSNELARVSFDRNGSTVFPVPKVYDEHNEPSELLASFEHIYLALSNGYVDGYRTSLTGDKKMEFVHYFDDDTSRHPDLLKKALMLFLIVNALCLGIAALYLFLVLLKSFIRPRARVSDATLRDGA